ncbi:MAG: hypothetical protein Q9211_002563 [Gyalolechia sp. 1 TL-2023]
MGRNDAPENKTSERGNPTQIASERLLRKRRSLTRLFTNSRASSRSRAPSPEDLDIPTTPTILGGFLPPLRKAAARASPSGSSEGCQQPVQSVRVDVTDVPATLNEHTHTKTHALKGILKPQTRSPNLQSSVPERGNEAPLESRKPVRSRTLSDTQKRRGAKYETCRSPIVCSVATPTESSSKLERSASPHARNRGASTTSLGLSRFRDAGINADVPPRPSTSGGERKGRRGKRTGGEGGEDHDLGLNFGPSSEPDPLDVSEIRASFRSAMTTNSGLVDASTARSSIMTKDTSVSDVTIDSPPWNDIEEGMTVDEAIGMYENGFADDVDSDHNHPSGISVSEEERRRSMKIAEAINDTIGSDATAFTQSLISASHEVARWPSRISSQSVHQRTPSIMPPTPTRDQYGFLKANRYITTAQHDTWNRVYVADQVRRTKKWSIYMREQGCTTYQPDQFPDRSPKTLRYIRKGVPPAWRGAAWFYYSGGLKLLKENPDTYHALISKVSELDPTDAESIERDLHRTFPDNIHFKPDQPTYPGAETALLSSLRRVLQAFAIHRPQIGYCQSLNFIAGLLLLLLPEDKAFWMVHIITTDYLPGTHETSLEGANVDLWVLMLALKESSPSIWAKIGVGDEDGSSIHTARLPPVSLCTTSWFMSMFIGTLPIESVLRVWDVVFYEGSKTLFRIALAIFKMGEQRIKDVNDSMELFQVVQAFPRGILDIGTLMNLACRRGGISQEWITKKRKERRKWYAKGTTTAGGVVTPVDIGDSPAGNGTPNLSRDNSAWRRRMGLVR